MTVGPDRIPFWVPLGKGPSAINAARDERQEVHVYADTAKRAKVDGAYDRHMHGPDAALQHRLAEALQTYALHV